MSYFVISILSSMTDFANLHYQISSRFLKPNKKTADLVGNEKMKASTSVRHIVIPCSTAARSQLIPDIIRCYSRSVVFFLPSFPFTYGL